MRGRWISSLGIVTVAIAVAAPAALTAQQPQTPRTAAPVQPSELPTRKTPAAPRRGASLKPYTPPRTPWGDPDISGVFTNSDESGIPFERPSEFDGRRLEDVSSDELSALNRKRQEQTIASAPTLSEFPGATSPLHWFENYNAANSRAWLVADPPDGHVPPPTAEAAARTTARARARQAHGPADSYEDRSLYDRCITRGLPGSMMPAIYGNSYQIHQGPGVVAIRYEMVNETRVIPLDGRPHLGPAIREYLGDARAHWDGSTLVVETTNFTSKTPYRGSSDKLRMIERFKPIAADTVEWSVTFDDPSTWARPWTFAMNLTKADASQQPFEYACHEGNYGMTNILTAARAEERAAAKESIAK